MWHMEGRKSRAERKEEKIEERERSYKKSCCGRERKRWKKRRKERKRRDRGRKCSSHLFLITLQETES